MLFLCLYCIFGVVQILFACLGVGWRGVPPSPPSLVSYVVFELVIPSAELCGQRLRHVGGTTPAEWPGFAGTASAARRLCLARGHAGVTHVRHLAAGEVARSGDLRASRHYNMWQDL